MNNNNNSDQLTNILKRLTILEANQSNQIPRLEIQLCGEIHIEEQVEEKEKCCICLEELDNDKNLVVLECGHKLNFTCFVQLMNTNRYNIKCPLCRATVNIGLRNTGIDDYESSDDDIPIQRASGIVRQSLDNLIERLDTDIDIQQEQHDEELIRRQRVIDTVERRREIRLERHRERRHRRLLSSFRRNTCKYIIILFLINSPNDYFTRDQIEAGMSRQFQRGTFRHNITRLVIEHFISSRSVNGATVYQIRN